MGWFLYVGALFQIWIGRDIGFETVNGAMLGVCGTINFACGTIVLAINDLRNRKP